MTTPMLIILPGRDTNPLVTALAEQAPDQEVIVWPDLGGERCEFAVTWNHEPGLLSRFPNLRVVSSFGAGIDHILADAHFPSHLRVVRIVDPYLVRDMVAWCLHALLAEQRQAREYVALQSKSSWRPLPPRELSRVGILGLGQLGGALANALIALGYEVHGWSRSGGGQANLYVYSGDEGLRSMVARVDAVVNLLPLTEATRGILDRTLFDHFQAGTILINAARGAHLVEADLLAALANGSVGAAHLDCFATEPLPTDHPFWLHPRVTVTPHVAALTRPSSAASQLLENLRRMQTGEPLHHQVDLTRGY